MTTTVPAPQPELRTLHPAYFAMVMATGIVSIAAQLLGMAPLAQALLVVNVVCAIALAILTILRIVWYPADVVSDLRHHGRAVGFFAMVAAIAVLGSQAVLVAHAWTAAVLLWFAAIALWVLLTYGIFTILTVQLDKPTLPEGINGGWLVSVVAPQSIACCQKRVPEKRST